MTHGCTREDSFITEESILVLHKWHSCWWRTKSTQYTLWSWLAFGRVTSCRKHTRTMELSAVPSLSIFCETVQPMLIWKTNVNNDDNDACTYIHTNLHTYITHTHTHTGEHTSTDQGGKIVLEY